MLTCMHAYRYSYKDKYAFLPLLKEKKKKEQIGPKGIGSQPSQQGHMTL